MHITRQKVTTPRFLFVGFPHALHRSSKEWHYATTIARIGALMNIEDLEGDC